MNGRILTLAAILLSVGLNAAAQIFLRSAARNIAPATGTAALLALVGKPGLWAGLVCYGVSLLAWLYVLSRAEVSFAYPFLGLGFVFVALASFFWLGETMPPSRLAGTALIVLGVIVLAQS